MNGGGVGSDHTSIYGDHTVACVGFSSYKTTQLLWLHDGWDSNLHHISYEIGIVQDLYG
jgi:hypothetical protein